MIYGSISAPEYEKYSVGVLKTRDNFFLILKMKKTKNITTTTKYLGMLHSTSSKYSVRFSGRWENILTKSSNLEVEDDHSRKKRI